MINNTNDNNNMNEIPRAPERLGGSKKTVRGHPSIQYSIYIYIYIYVYLFNIANIVYY